MRRTGFEPACYPLVPDPRSGAFDLFATAARNIYTGGSNATCGISTSVFSMMRFMSFARICFCFFSLSPLCFPDILHTAPLRGKRTAGIEPAYSGSAIHRIAFLPHAHMSPWWGLHPPPSVYGTDATLLWLHGRSRRRELHPLSHAYQACAVLLPPRRRSYVVLPPEQIRSVFLVVKRFAPLFESLLASRNHFLTEFL